MRQEWGPRRIKTIKTRKARGYPISLFSEALKHAQRLTAGLRGAPPVGRRLAFGNLLVGHGGCREAESQPPVPASQVRKPAGRYMLIVGSVGGASCAAGKAPCLNSVLLQRWRTPLVQGKEAMTQVLDRNRSRRQQGLVLLSSLIHVAWI